MMTGRRPEQVEQSGHRRLGAVSMADSWLVVVVAVVVGCLFGWFVVGPWLYRRGWRL